jgi:hypothetical protein
MLDFSRTENFFVAQFQPGDYLIFQLESGFGLLRVLAIDENDNEPVWHLAAYNELFLDVEFADMAIENPHNLTFNEAHVALTNRAFESTPVSKMLNLPLQTHETQKLNEWRENPQREISDRSIRLMLGLR